MEIRKGNREDTEQFIELLYDVRNGMEHPEWFFLDSPQEIRELMDNGTMQLWLAVDGNRLAAALDILIPGLEEYNYGYDLGLDEADLPRVINMDSAAVRPDYRGQGLQKRLLEAAEHEIAQMGDRILLCTVHPDNRFSLDNVLKQGYAIQRKIEKYGSVRFVLRKDILQKNFAES